MHKLRALRASFEESIQQLEGATASLGSGRLPAVVAAERLQALQEQFEQVRESLLAEASSHDVVVPDELETLEALEELGRAIESKQRGDLHRQIGDVLSRTTSLNHREEVVFQSLQQIREEAIRLSGDDAPLDELQRLVDGSHPFVQLLQLVEDDDSLSNDDVLAMSRVVEETFGRALAVAVLRKRLLLGPGSVMSGPSLPSLLADGAPPLSPSGVYEEALAHERKVSARASSEKRRGDLDTREEEPTLGARGLQSPPGKPPETDPSRPPTPFRENKRGVDTWDELPASQADASAVVGSGVMPSAHSDLPPPPFMSSSASSDPTPPTDEVPVIVQSEISGQFPGHGLSFDDEEEPTTEDRGFAPLQIPGEAGLIEVPSIEMMAVAAMNAVLVPGASQEDIEAAVASVAESHRSPQGAPKATPPRPPSTPRKMPTPTFLTPLPLSVNMAPGGVIQPGRQHDMAVAAAQRAQSLGSQTHISGVYDDPGIRTPISSQALPSSAMLHSASAASLAGLSSPSLGGVAPLESFDAMLIRQSDPHDPSRFSPLTVWQSNELQRREHGVAVLFGSSALGLEDLADFIEMSVGSEQLYVIDQVYAPHRFLRQIRQIANRRDGQMTFVLVTQQTPWDSSWVRGALELVGQMKAASRPLRITFVADPPSTWSMIPSIQPLQQDGAMMLSLQPWHDSALLKWLQQLDFPFDHKIRRSIRRVTGNWSFALKFFYRQMIQSPNQWARHLGSLKQVLESRELAQKALRIMGLTHKTTLSILHKLTIEEPATQESMERAFAHAPPRLITRALLWAERLSLAQYENYFWTTNPLVARLLKSLR